MITRTQRTAIIKRIKERIKRDSFLLYKLLNSSFARELQVSRLHNFNHVDSSSLNFTHLFAFSGSFQEPLLKRYLLCFHLVFLYFLFSLVLRCNGCYQVIPKLGPRFFSYCEITLIQIINQAWSFIDIPLSPHCR